MKPGKVIGTGNTAMVYEWEEGKVLKLFYPGYPKEAVEKEFYNANAVSPMGFEKAKAYEMIAHEGRTGILYDQIQGQSLFDWVMETRNIQGCAVHMANLHKSIARNPIGSVPDYRDFLASNIKKALSIDPERKNEALHILDRLQEGNTLCHGDFHPGNIILSQGKAVVIDFMNICRGDALYDIARTVFLVQYTPVPPVAEDRETLVHFKKTLADLYLMEMHVTREMIRNHLKVLIAARAGECPAEEVTSETWNVIMP